MFVGCGQPGGLDARPAAGVRLVALRDAGLTQTEGLAVDLDGRRALRVGDLVDELLGLLAHEAVDGERAEVGDAPPVLVFGGALTQGIQPFNGFAREESG